MKSRLAVFRNHKQKIATFFSILLSLNLILPSIAMAKENEIKYEAEHYNELANLYLPSLVKKEMKEIEKAKEIQKHNENLNKNNLKKIIIPDIGEVEKLRILYQIFASQKDIDSKVEEQKVLQENVAYDLNMFCGDESELEKSLFTILNNAETGAGKIQLQKMLFKPTTNILELKRRQAIIAILISNEKLFNELNGQVKLLKKAESQFLWLWKDLNKEVLNYFNKVYFDNFLLKKFNSNSSIMGLNALRQVTGDTFLVVFVEFLNSFIVAMINRFTQDCITIEDGTEGFNIYNFNFSKLPMDMLRFEFDPTQNYKFFKQIFDGDSTVANVYLGLWIFNKAMNAKRLYNSVEIGKERLEIIDHIQRRTIGLASYTNVLEQIKQTVKSNKTLFTLLPMKKTFIDSNNDKKAVKLLNLLNSGTFKGDVSFFSHKGKALAAFKQMNDSKNTFIDSIKAVGELDAYLSIAKLYKKHATNEDAHYCFVKYLEQENPYFEIKDFWHPELDPNNVVTNDVELGKDNRNIILTGPNAGGKSTILKAITTNLILAQSFGIAPASKMTMTPFSLINTYLNITDTIGKESLFQAEMNRSKELIDKIKNLKPGEFSFIIMDEVFTGTNPKEGAAGAYGILKYLSKFGYHLSINATHFVEQLSRLENDTNGIFKNKKVVVDRDENGKISCPYTWENGVTDQAVALDLLQQSGGFSDEILSEAYSVLNSGSGLAVVA